VPVEVTIPGPLLQYTRNQKEVQLNADSVLDAIKELDRKFPGMKDRICDEQEKVREYVNIFVNGEDFRHMKSEQTKLKDGDEMMILPSIAGGSI
jgi:sulfur-carrier protein